MTARPERETAIHRPLRLRKPPLRRNWVKGETPAGFGAESPRPYAEAFCQSERTARRTMRRAAPRIAWVPSQSGGTAVRRPPAQAHRGGRRATAGKIGRFPDDACLCRFGDASGHGDSLGARLSRAPPFHARGRAYAGCAFGHGGRRGARGGRDRFNGYSDAFDLTVYVHKNARPVAGALRSVPSRSGRRGGGGGTGERLCRMAAYRAASAVQGKPWQPPYPQSAFRFG